MVNIMHLMPEKSIGRGLWTDGHSHFDNLIALTATPERAGYRLSFDY